MSLPILFVSAAQSTASQCPPGRRSLGFLSCLPFPTEVGVSLMAEPRRRLTSALPLASEFHIWGPHEPPSPVCKPMSHFCLLGKTNQPRKESRLPWASPAAGSWHEQRHPPPPSLLDSRADGQVRDLHPGRADGPRRAGPRACARLALASPRPACFALGCKFIFRSRLPPSPSLASILRKQTGMCSGFAGKSDRSLPTCSGRLRYGVN